MRSLFIVILSFVFILHTAGEAEAKKSKKQKVYLIKRKALPVLNIRQLGQLHHHQRIRYVMHMRRAYDLGETIHRKLKFKPRKKSAYLPGMDNEIWALILGEAAYAESRFSPSDYCIHSGHLIRRTSGNCSIKAYPSLYRRRNNKEYVACGPSTGLRGKYTSIPFTDNSSGGRPYEPGITMNCHTYAQALNEAFTKGTVERILKDMLPQIQEDRDIYQSAIKEYEEYLRSIRGKPLTEESLRKRLKLLEPIREFTFIPEVEAHEIKLAADYHNKYGNYPAAFDGGSFEDTFGSAVTFDKLAYFQEAVERLGKGNPPTKQDLVKLGFDEKRAERISAEILASINQSTDQEERERKGKEFLREYFGIDPKDGIYSSYEEQASNMDFIYGQIIDYCVGPIDNLDPNRALNRAYTIGCDRSNKNVKDCMQFQECMTIINESGSGLSGGRFKSVMDAYINLRDNLYTVCSSLPPDESGAIPICVLESDPDQPEGVDIVPAAETSLEYLERSSSFGCSSEKAFSDLIARTPAACAFCSLEADAKVKEELKESPTDYIENGISEKWLTLLTIMAKICGEPLTKAQQGKDERWSLNVLSVINYAQVFGHCSASTYNWDPTPRGRDYNFITFVQDEDFQNETDANKRKAVSLGWVSASETYMSFINRKFKELFGLHFQRTQAVKASTKRQDESHFGTPTSKRDKIKTPRGPNYQEGLSEMFCGSINQPKTADELLGDTFNKYEAGLKSVAGQIDGSLQKCINEGIAFAKKHYHQAIGKDKACYIRSTDKPISGQVETGAPIILSQDQWRCGYSTSIFTLQNTSIDAITFFEPWAENESGTKLLGTMRLAKGNNDRRLGTMRTAKGNKDRRCGRSCDSSGQETDFILQNQCLVSELSTLPGSPSNAPRSGGDRNAR